VARAGAGDDQHGGAALEKDALDQLQLVMADQPEHAAAFGAGRGSRGARRRRHVQLGLDLLPEVGV
jgi:hypothetical protein